LSSGNNLFRRFFVEN